MVIVHWQRQSTPRRNANACPECREYTALLPPEWAAELNRLADRDAKNDSQNAAASVQEMQATIAELDGKIARITDLFVEQDIERGEYLSRKRELMFQKRSLQEQSLLLERDAAHWLEPMREWINEAQALHGIAQSKNYPSKKSSLQKVFGSNLTLHAREARGTAQNQWLSLAQAKTDFPKMGLISTVVTLPGVGPGFRA
jgi:TolA-binding protein